MAPVTKNTMTQVQARVAEAVRKGDVPWQALLQEVQGRNYDKVTLSRLLKLCVPKDDWSGTDKDLEVLIGMLRKNSVAV